jgi:hypothetical protein
MITAKYTLADTPGGTKIKVKNEQVFETINELEHFIAYNRAYFVSLKFSGSFKKEEEK